jgi:hypothetical protein
VVRVDAGWLLAEMMQVNPASRQTATGLLPAVAMRESSAPDAISSLYLAIPNPAGRFIAAILDVVEVLRPDRPREDLHPRSMA